MVQLLEKSKTIFFFTYNSNFCEYFLIVPTIRNFMKHSADSPWVTYRKTLGLDFFGVTYFAILNWNTVVSLVYTRCLSNILNTFVPGSVSFWRSKIICWYPQQFLSSSLEQAPTRLLKTFCKKIQIFLGHFLRRSKLLEFVKFYPCLWSKPLSTSEDSEGCLVFT